MSMDRLAYKNDTYDELADANRKASTEIKIAAKPKGQLSDGYTKLSAPAHSDRDHHSQTKAERSSVGGRYRTGHKLHGKASPSSEESFLKQRKNHESSSK